MLRTVALISLFLFISMSEPTNFDYSSHGDDWNCPKNASKQSPIQLSANEGIQKSKDSYLFCDFFNSSGIVNFLNTTIYLSTNDSFGSIYTRLIDGVSVPFKANEIRLRMHSQHKTPEGYTDLEVQIFHTELYPTTRNYRLAVGLLFNVSQTMNPFIQEIIEAYSINKTVSSINVDLRQLLPINIIDDYWFYLGSITIPPCTNGKVNWVVNRKIYSISEEQKKKLTQIMSQGDEKWTGNWRNLQARNGNMVGYRNISSLTFFDQ